MNDLDIAALLVSRVCHDLVSPIGAVVNGIEVLEEEIDGAMRADALRLVAGSAEKATTRLQFVRIAYGAAGSAGAELDLTEIARIMTELFKDGKVEFAWQAEPVNWPKDWAKLLMNVAQAAGDCLPRGGRVTVETVKAPGAPGFSIIASGAMVRLLPESERALAGEPAAALDGRTIQPYLTHLLAKGLNAGLSVTATPGEVRFAAG